MESLLKGRRSNVPEGPLTALQVRSPNGPSALTAPGPLEVGGEHVDGHQDLIPAMQAEWHLPACKRRACVASV